MYRWLLCILGLLALQFVVTYCSSIFVSLNFPIPTFASPCAGIEYSFMLFRWLVRFIHGRRAGRCAGCRPHRPPAGIKSYPPHRPVAFFSDILQTGNIVMFVGQNLTDRTPFRRHFLAAFFAASLLARVACTACAEEEARTGCRCPSTPVWVREEFLELRSSFHRCTRRRKTFPARSWRNHNRSGWPRRRVLPCMAHHKTHAPRAAGRRWACTLAVRGGTARLLQTVEL